MSKLRKKRISMVAKSIMDDVIISASEYTVIPGNTIEGYVTILIDNYVDTTGMKDEEIDLLRKLLSDAATSEIAEKN